LWNVTVDMILIFLEVSVIAKVRRVRSVTYFDEVTD
jgi:hypothetical protein